MLHYGTSGNVKVLLTYMLKIYLTIHGTGLFFQNEIVNFHNLILMVNLSPIALIIFKILLVAFSSILKHA